MITSKYAGSSAGEPRAREAEPLALLELGALRVACLEPERRGERGLAALGGEHPAVREEEVVAAELAHLALLREGARAHDARAALHHLRREELVHLARLEAGVHRAQHRDSLQLVARALHVLLQLAQLTQRQHDGAELRVFLVRRQLHLDREGFVRREAVQRPLEQRAQLAGRACLGRLRVRTPISREGEVGVRRRRAGLLGRRAWSADLGS